MKFSLCFVFDSIYCDGWVMIANFSWRQSRHILDILLWAGADFITSQVMFDVMFPSFSFKNMLIVLYSLSIFYLRTRDCGHMFFV